MRRLRVLCFSDAYDDYVGSFVNGLVSHADVWLAHDERANTYVRPYLDPAVRTVVHPYRRLRDPRRLLAVPRLASLAARLGVDVVHVHQSGDPWFNLAQVRPLHVPRIDTVHDVSPHPGDRTSVRGAYASYHHAVRRTARFIVHAPVLREQMIASWDVAPDTVDVVPMGELGSLYGGPLPRPAEPGVRVVFYGRIWPYKGLDRLILAMNRLADARPGLTLVIAGQGEELDRYVALASPALRLDLRNRRVGADETREILTDATVVCLPYVEASQSGVFALAYGFGVPVVATTVGGLPFAVHDGHDGLLVPPDDVEALTAALGRVLDDDALRVSLRRGVAERVATDLDWRTIGAQTVEVYERAVRERGSSV